MPYIANQGFKCQTIHDIPSLEQVMEKLESCGYLKVVYKDVLDIEFIASLSSLIRQIEKEPSLGFEKSDYFAKAEVYVVYNQFLELELLKIAPALEKATKDYKNICEQLIGQFEEKYDFSFTGSKGSLFSKSESITDNRLSEEWIFNFHGGDICFVSEYTGQVVDVNLKFSKRDEALNLINNLPQENYYGVLDLWFFQYFMETTEEFKKLSEHFKKNEYKLQQVINFLGDLGKLKLVRSYVLDEEYFIWDDL